MIKVQKWSFSCRVQLLNRLLLLLKYCAVEIMQTIVQYSWLHPETPKKLLDVFH
jgi:hypothetical protein